jgi:hypothetical protein
MNTQQDSGGRDHMNATCQKASAYFNTFTTKHKASLIRQSQMGDVHVTLFFKFLKTLIAQRKRRAWNSSLQDPLKHFVKSHIGATQDTGAATSSINYQPLSGGCLRHCVYSTPTAIFRTTGAVPGAGG